MTAPRPPRGGPPAVPANSRPGSAAAASSGSRRPVNPEVARLMVDAEAFLRLGLVDKAIAHLTGALNRDPSLRDLREPLVKLYVARRRNKSAITELWALLSRCDDPKEEIRFLRYILRLGEKDPAAQSRLQEILSQHPVESSGDELLATEPGSVGEELRDYLRQHKPPTDLSTTQLIPEIDTQRLMNEPDRAAEITNPNGERVEEVAEEMAYHNGSLRQELDEVDACLQQSRFADALPLLRTLSERYPHSKRVQGRLEQLRRARPHALDSAPPARAAVAPSREADLHAATTLQLNAKRSDGTQTKSRRTAGQRRLADIGNSTLEVDPDDIAEEQAAPPPAAPTRRGPPPPPGPSSLLTSTPESASARAYKAGMGLRGQEQFEQAMVLFQTACSDPAYSVAGLLMIGLCYRDLDRLHDAVRVLLRAINLPQARDSELSELFYELGATYELLANPAEAILYYQLSLGSVGAYRDAGEKISSLQAVMVSG